METQSSGLAWVPSQQAACCGGTGQERGASSTRDGPEKRKIWTALCKTTVAGKYTMFVIFYHQKTDMVVSL